MSFFDKQFPGVRDMLERDSRTQAARAPDHGKPWCVMGLSFGRPVIESCHATEEEAKDALAAIHRTCAPFIRHTFHIERRGD